MHNMPKGTVLVQPNELMNIPVGSVIYVGKKLDSASHWDQSEDGSTWFVFTEGKAMVIDLHYPDSETEDLDWFKPWQVIIVGFNKEYILA